MRVRTLVLSFGFTAIASGALAQQDVVWTGVVNATASGSTIQKTGGCDGCQDAGGTSQQQIAGGTGTVEFTSAADGLVFVGLSHATTPPPLQHTQIDYAFAISAGGGCDIREFGAWKADATCAAGDRLAIAIEAGPSVKFYRNGAVVYTSATAPANYPYVLGADLLSAGSSVQAAQVTPGAGVPTTYQANSTRDLLPKPALPSLGPAGFRFTDPTFGSRIIRVTDENTRPGSPGRSYTASSAASTLAWNAGSNRFWVRSKDGTFIPYTFDAATMTASRIQPSGSGDGGLTIASQSEPQFSFVRPNILFGSRQDATNDWPVIRQFDFDTLSYADLIDLGALTAIGHSSYVGALSSSAAAPEKVCVVFGATQDSHYKIAVFEAGAPVSTAVVLDTMGSTITVNGTTTSTNIPLGVHLHSGSIDQSGRYVFFTPTNAQPVPFFLWDLATNTLRAISTNAGGHGVAAYGVMVNQDCCVTTTWDAAQWELRSLAQPDTVTDLIDPVLTPKEVYLADHTSWSNAQPSALVPFLSSLYRYYDGTLNDAPWRAWDGEIVAVQTSAAGSNATVWRFAHNRSDISYDGDPTRAFYFWYSPNAVISPNGRWAIFASNWEKTIGPAADAEPGGGSRIDVFLLELR